MKRRNNGFTLIELIAVLVIMAIIALIVTPLVMNIVKKAKDSANKRSVDAYGKAVELAVATYLLDNGEYPDTLDNLTVEYIGNEVICNIKNLNEDGSIYLSECSVKGTEVKDASTEDRYYHYGKTSEIAYQSYKIGDVVTYNGMNFYVIADSDETSESVTLLKEEPLTVDEVNTYGGVGTANNHVNMYSTYNTSAIGYQTAKDKNGYGAMAYYSSEICGYNGSSWVYDGCTNDYEESEIKYVVDAWTTNKSNVSDLTEDSLGYKTRLLTHEDLENILEPVREKDVPSWVYNSNYIYWLMSPWKDSASNVWVVADPNGTASVFFYMGCTSDGVVRPVITLLKSSI